MGRLNFNDVGVRIFNNSLPRYMGASNVTPHRIWCMGHPNDTSAPLVGSLQKMDSNHRLKVMSLVSYHYSILRFIKDSQSISRQLDCLSLFASFSLVVVIGSDLTLILVLYLALVGRYHPPRNRVSSPATREQPMPRGILWYRLTCSRQPPTIKTSTNECAICPVGFTLSII